MAFFNVVGVYDLNMDSGAAVSTTITIGFFIILPDQRPQCVSESKMFGSLCCVSGPLTATVRLDRAGYVPGERIDLQAEADNKS